MLRTTFDSSGATMSGANKSAMQRFLIISGHDFRTPRWANMHFIARELARRGQRTATDANRGSPAESVAPIERNVPRVSDRPQQSRSS